MSFQIKYKKIVGNVNRTGEYTEGYTLVETILYATLVVVLLGAITNTSVLLSKSYREIKTSRNIQSSALSVMDVMSRNIREASSVDGTGTYYGISTGSLLLRSTDSGGNPQSVRFYLSGGQVLMDKGGALFGPLTDAKVAVSSLLFRPIDTGNSVGVKIELIINGKTFYNTVMLRGSYN